MARGEASILPRIDDLLAFAKNEEVTVYHPTDIEGKPQERRVDGDFTGKSVLRLHAVGSWRMEFQRQS